MKELFEFKLVKPAKNKGGDRYITESGWTVYFPQEITRPDGGRPADILTVEVSNDN